MVSVFLHLDLGECGWQRMRGNKCVATNAWQLMRGTGSDTNAGHSCVALMRVLGPSPA